jgi:hypothetical protein
LLIFTIFVIFSKQAALARDLQLLASLLENEDWEQRNDGLKKLQELAQKGAAEHPAFPSLFEKHIQKLLLHQVLEDRLVSFNFENIF